VSIELADRSVLVTVQNLNPPGVPYTIQTPSEALELCDGFLRKMDGKELRRRNLAETKRADKHWSTIPTGCHCKVLFPLDAVWIVPPEGGNYTLTLNVFIQVLGPQSVDGSVGLFSGKAFAFTREIEIPSLNNASMPLATINSEDFLTRAPQGSTRAHSAPGPSEEATSFGPRIAFATGTAHGPGE
jgi:hypothetical protein